MKTTVYSEVVHQFDNTTDAINHFTTENGSPVEQGKFPWGIVIALTAMAIIGGIIYWKEQKSNQPK
jgi:hypothetical protein